ncbi:type 3 dihydrofolate reductase [Grimontia hollisae]|uniref:Dihydrofolate reductase n=2 Tax=Grimontia hollisae TaxID=673 RepID=D0I8H5_GRIHO|nr:type 3 dihydrofolate reductase [Grimontia hollisae]AMG30946.1 type 3 dihydrofolate reductase [Grimontia hollisae]EEY72944.1 dihydrofolate reductase [Grimontia hollisae CIP 101886]MDF2184063.1 type 3 dihydrofolate reductase [Grimontia hollisae]STO47045.1 Dihydrofolate reductase type 3 [Grimontia hollisae]STO56130.1 Dihydrofolate reductase type 3 [Grimontia hollisae]
MKISMIAAMAKGRVIGKDNAMPWHLPADFAWFKQNTLGKPVIMGRKTYESIGRPLPGRRNIVISRDESWAAEGVESATSIDAAIALAGAVEEAVIIGGGAIYTACLPRADKLYLTFIDADIEGDTCFPDWGEGWLEVQKTAFVADEKNRYNMEFVVLERE